MPAASKTLGGKQMSETYRECRLQIVYKHQFGTQLYACAVIHLMFRTRIPGRQTCTEERALYPCGIAEQGAEIVHSNGAQVQFGSGLGIRVCLYGVDVGSWHGQCCTVLEGIAVINTVIAESAQIGIAKDGGRISEVMAGSRAQPERVVAVYGKEEADDASYGNQRAHHHEYGSAETLRTVPVVLVRERPGGADAEGVVLPHAGQMKPVNRFAYSCSDT